jgi:hypothetical protein
MRKPKKTEHKTTQNYKFAEALETHPKKKAHTHTILQKLQNAKFT